ncbi:hypothetical protein ACVW0P_000711 [Mucilaginibacter sp. UYNi724]
MKKIKTLQILFYIIFALYFLQNFGSEIYNGAKDGFNDSIGIEDHGPFLGPAIFTVLKGNLIPGVKTDSLQVGHDYHLKNIMILADVWFSKNLQAPVWIKILKILTALLMAVLIGYIASFINKVMLSIYKGTMFEGNCIKLIRKIGVYILLYALADYVYQWMDFLKATALLRPPLILINTVSFSFGTALFAMFVFILAEAFKQGGKLKEEQELTI